MLAGNKINTGNELICKYFQIWDQLPISNWLFPVGLKLNPFTKSTFFVSVITLQLAMISGKVCCMTKNDFSHFKNILLLNGQLNKI